MDAQHTSAADDRALAEAKTTLRRAVTLRRRSRPTDQRERDDRARTEQLIGRLAGISSVACYFSSAPEPDTRQLISWLQLRGIRLLLPFLTRSAGLPSEPDWALYTGPEQLVEGPYSIIQPDGPALGADAVRDVAMIILPGLAANLAGDRLGRGGGWYDRVLGRVPAGVEVVILLNDDEVLPAIPTQRWDRPVTAIATPTRWLGCSREHP